MYSACTLNIFGPFSEYATVCSGYARAYSEHVQHIVEYIVSILKCTLRFLKWNCIRVYSKYNSRALLRYALGILE